MRPGDEVDLVQHDDLRQHVEAGAVRGELGVDRPPLLLERLRDVEHVDQRAGPLEMGEELVAEADAFARALDQARHVGDDELPAVGRLDGAEHRLERRERVVGHLRPGVRDAGEERRLARVGQADERGVREQLQVQLDVALLAGQADLGEARHLARRADEARVAAAARSAPGEHDARARMREVGDQLVAVANLRSDRDAELDVGAVRAVLAGAAAVATLRSLDQSTALERGQVAQRRVRDEHDVAAPAAVAAVGPPFGIDFSRRNESPPSPPLPALT